MKLLSIISVFLIGCVSPLPRPVTAPYFGERHVVRHVVRPGQSMAGLAQYYRTDLMTVYIRNQLQWNSPAYVGQILYFGVDEHQSRFGSHRYFSDCSEE
jgi:outer membrane scaffolding protein for murein synthesis (MipA/OmpV family)